MEAAVLLETADVQRVADVLVGRIAPAGLVHDPVRLGRVVAQEAQVARFDRHARLVVAGRVDVGQRADVGPGPRGGRRARGQGRVGVGAVRRRVPRRDLGVVEVERAVLRRDGDDVGREVGRPALQPQLVDVAARRRAAQGERGAVLDLQVDVQLPDLVRRVHLHEGHRGAQREDGAGRLRAGGDVEPVRRRREAHRSRAGGGRGGRRHHDQRDGGADRGEQGRGPQHQRGASDHAEPPGERMRCRLVFVGRVGNVAAIRSRARTGPVGDRLDSCP